MAALAEIATSGPLASIIRATQRLNPCMELDVDVLAVSRVDALSTQADWTNHAGVAGVLTNTSADPKTGLLRLTPTTPVSLFSQTAAHSVQHTFTDASNGAEEYALDFFVDPSISQGVSFTLDSLTLWLNASNLKGFFRVVVGYYDQYWHRIPMGDPIDILSGDVVAAQIAAGDLTLTVGCAYKIDFTALARRFVFAGGSQNTVTGDGRDSSGNARAQTVNPRTGKSSMQGIARGLSISITPMGANFSSASIGLVPTATATAFNTNNFWRVASGRNCGPYDPTNQPYPGVDANHNPDDHLGTGAVPGFGAIAVTNGSWGIARRILTAQRAQNPLTTWEQPYHDLKVIAYPSTGTAVNVIDMGGTPTNPVELRLDDVQQAGTTITYSLKGSNTSATGPWTAITANTDGSVLSGSDLYRWYQLTTTFTPGPTGTTKYASPALQAWTMVERVQLSTYRYLKDFDSTSIADPVTAQSSIAELKLPVMNVGRQDYRDLAAQLGSNYAPASLEAHVYARNTRSGVRYFKDSFRLENREPQYGAEEMTFVSGMDRLTVKIPSAIETYRYPASGQVAITNVTHVGAVYTISIGSTPFPITSPTLAGYRMHGVTGACAGIDYPILSSPANTTSAFAVNIATGAIPAIGDTFEIHSDQTTRTGASYVGQNYGLVYADLLAVQAAVPARYRGQLPGDANGKVYAADGVTERKTSCTLPADGVKALDVLQDVALHCGGFPGWDKGRIQFVDVYGKKDSVATWDDRHIVSLETPLGADRRMPRVRASYGYQADTQKFTNQATTDDFDTILGWGLPNLFDVSELPDNFCKWNDQAEASFITSMLQTAWKSGVRLWKVKTVLMWPHLVQGSAVTIVTDQYTDRRLAYSPDGLTDLGYPVAGRISAVAVIVGKNLWGDEFIVAVRGLDQITSAAVSKAGSVAIAPTTVSRAPIATITPLNTEADDTTWNLRFNATAGSGGGGTNLTYVLFSKSDFSVETTVSSGNATAFPLDLVVARDLKKGKTLRLVVTDTNTGLTNTATFFVASQAATLKRTIGGTDVSGDTLGGGLGADVENMVVNGGGQDGAVGSQATGWTLGSGNALVPDTSQSYVGDRSLTVNNVVGADSYSSEDFAVVDTGVYELSGWIKVASLAGTGEGAILQFGPVSGISSFTILEKIGYSPVGGSGQPDVGVSRATGSSGWTFVRSVFRVNGTGTGRLYAQLGYGAAVSGQAWFDGVKLRRVPQSTNEGGYRAFQSHDATGHVVRGRPFSDGLYALRATETDGSSKTSGAHNPQGSMAPASMQINPFSYSAGGPSSGKMWVSFSWPAFTYYRADGTSVSIPASSSLATPPSPTLSQIAGGPAGPRTLFVKIGYTKNNVIMRVGAEASLSVLNGNQLKVTSPGSVAGYDGWVAMVGTSSGGEFIQVSTTFGSDYTEGASGFNATTTTPYNSAMDNAATAAALPASTQLFWYPYYDIVATFMLFASRGVTVKSETDAQTQNGDGHVPMSFGGMFLTTPAGGVPGSGTPTNGGGRFA